MPSHFSELDPKLDDSPIQTLLRTGAKDRAMTFVIAFTILFAGITNLAAVPARAQSNGSSTEASPLWEVHLHLQRSFASPVGQRVMAMVEKNEPDKVDQFVKFAEAIGLDPRTEIGEVVLFGDGFEETDATLIASLGQSTGNLEGWILAAPGYRSEDLDANTQLHSMTVEDKNARAWFALPKHTQTGNYVLVASLDQGRTVQLAKEVLAGNPSPVPNPLKGNTILSFFVNDLSAVPMEIDDSEPGSAIVRIIEQFGLNVASDDDKLHLVVDISASSAGKARQISQLLMGLKALVQLAPLDEPKAQKAAKILDSLSVNYTEGDSHVEASLSATYRVLEDLIQSAR
jgi:hypothetical protein